MKKSLRPEQTKKVAILSLLGLVLMGLTGYYMYQAYTTELSSSAAMCSKSSYDCTCSNGSTKKLSYNYCDSKFVRYQQCKASTQNQGNLELEAKKAEARARLYKATHKKVISLYTKAAGSDKIMTNNECRAAGYCSDKANDDKPVNPLYVKKVAKAGLSDYQRYSDLNSKWTKAKEDLQKATTSKTEQLDCKNDSTIYESNKQTYIQNQCARLCNSARSK